MDWVGMSKIELRATILHARKTMTSEQRRTEVDALLASIPGLVRAGEIVCAYVPIGSEPGSVRLLDAILAAGGTVQLPVARTDSAGIPQPLNWGEYTVGRLVDADYALREPPPPWSPPEALALASVVLVPALAVDRTGVRLGRGAGFYDRSLPLARADAKLIAVVRDTELVDSLPRQDHDVPMTHALTPGRGLLRLTGDR